MCKLWLAVALAASAQGKTVAPRAVALNNREKLLAGGSARFGAQLVMYPADALRTLAQTRKGAKTLSELGARTLVSGCATTSMFAAWAERMPERESSNAMHLSLVAHKS